MQVARQHQSWKINVQARARKFNFKLKATKIFPPTWKFHRFLLLLRLHKFNLELQLRSGSTVSISRTLKSTFLRFIGKLRFRPVKKAKALTIQIPDLESVLNRLKRFSSEKSICSIPLVFVILGSLLQSVLKKDLEGIITHALIILIITLLYIKRFVKGNCITVWVLLIVGTAGCWAAFRLYNGFQIMVGAGWHGGALLFLLSVGGAAFRVIFAILKLLFRHFSKINGFRLHKKG